MKSHSSLFLLAALGVMSAGAAQAVDTSAWKCEKCPYPTGTSGTLDAGLALVSDSSARFGDYTGLQRSGAHLVLGGTLMTRGPDGYFANAEASDLGLGSRSLSAESGHEGRYSLRLRFAEIPRHLADDAQSPFLGSGGSVLTLPAGYPAGSTATMPLATTLQPVALGYDLKRFDIGGTLIGGEHWTYRVSLHRDARDGTRGTAGSFFANAAQFVVPVDQHTDELTLSASYASRRMQGTLSYQLSQFRNAATALTWSNPFFPVVPGATQGQLALAPDNQMHQISGSAGYELTPTVRASGEFAVGRLTQNAAYLAPTLNAGLAATVPALPASSLDGRVDTFSGSARLTATPADGVRLQASFARDVRDNRTAVNAYPIVTTDMFVQPGTRSNTPFSYWTNRYKLSADVRGTESWKFAAGVDREDRQRSYAEVVNTHETTIWARASMQPRDDTTLAFKLAHANRDGGTYGTATWFGAPENPLLRKYNLADRQRDTVGARADIAFGEKTSLGLSVDLSRDDYSTSAIGLQEARNANLGADLSVALSEQTQFNAYLQSERVRSLQAGSQSFSAADWTASNRDRFEVLGFGLKHAAIPDKLDVGADVVFARSRSKVTVDVGTGDPQFPSAATSQDSFRFFANYKLRDNLWVNTNVWYQVYEAQDWHLDGVLPATVSNLLSFGAQPPRYGVGVVQVVVRHRF